MGLCLNCFSAAAAPTLPWRSQTHTLTAIARRIRYLRLSASQQRRTLSFAASEARNLSERSNNNFGLPSGDSAVAIGSSTNRFDDGESLEGSRTPDDDMPRAVQSAYLRPLRRQPSHGIPVCDLQLRSYTAANLEFFADFAVRAAYFLEMPIRGPIPLPRIVERWTVPRSNFINKKSQQNFERKTLRRLLQVQDAMPETVEVWLSFLRKHAYHGVGLKANVWEHEALGFQTKQSSEDIKIREVLDESWRAVARQVESVESVTSVERESAAAP